MKLHRRLRLLSINSKLAKSAAKYPIITAGLSLAPHRRSGFNVCDNAGFCSVVCNLWFSGHTVQSNVRGAMIRRARRLHMDPVAFYRDLYHDLDLIAAESETSRQTAYVRLNVASDLDWSEVIRRYPTIRFYDYTKIKSRADAMAHGKLPENYWITPSYNERMHINSVRSYLRRGVNVSVVFDTDYFPQCGRIGTLPEEWRGMPVVDGDHHDLRHPDFDGFGNIIGLRFKGSRKLLQAAIDKGFVVAA